MAPTSPPIDQAIGRLLRPRDAALMSPALLCGEPGSTAARLQVRVGRTNWPTLVRQDATGAVQAATVRDTRLVLVGGRSFGWVHQAVRTLRPAGRFPIAVLATDVQPEQVLTLLDAGANLVLESHAGAREVLARLLALCRSSLGDSGGQVRWLHAGELRLDLAARRCVLAETPIPLGHNEFDLLAYLMGRSQQVVPQHEILQQVWGWRQGDGSNTLRIHIGRLRRKLGDTAVRPQWIGSVRGVGYQFLPPVAELGDDRGSDRLRESMALLNAQADALKALVDGVTAAADETAVAETVVQWAVDRGFSDAATVFRFDLDQTDPLRRTAGASRLVASAGMSARWQQSISTGHPISDGFLGAEVYSSGKVVQLRDMSGLAKRFPFTARMSYDEDLHACVLFPLHVHGLIWGDLAFVSRTDRAFTPARTAFLRTVAGVVSLAFAAQAGRPGAHDA
ncbi:GAF domain-containing protein [Micromonospora zingiberis]|uniref:GAF domain-containing protein n=1 Tax=Micromonospora zingiberis TaxID=2053011 RepID=A0A4R0GKS4_9ACTN|nr:winged helix-turn-helix domain-containing protein [Micromonospora zingiberis]TCB97162.1 GAF domain-containing protein [Micromonospora zingiberis]